MRQEDKNTIWLLFVAVAIFWCWAIIKKYRPTKSDLANYYGVSRLTFVKWLKGVLKEEYNQFDKRRYFTFLEFLRIKDELGNKDVFPVLSRKQFIEISNSNHKSLAYTTNFLNDKLKLPKGFLKNLRKFPPVIGSQIAYTFGVYKEEIESYLSQKDK